MLRISQENHTPSDWTWPGRDDITEAYEGSCTDVHLGHNKCRGNKIEFGDACYGPSILHSEM